MGGRERREREEQAEELNSLSLVETGRIRRVLELRFLMAIVSWEGNERRCGRCRVNARDSSQRAWTPRAPDGSRSRAAAETRRLKSAAAQRGRWASSSRSMARQQKQITERRKLLIVHGEVVSKCPLADHWLEFNYLLMHACMHSVNIFVCFVTSSTLTLAKEFDGFAKTLRPLFSV